MGAIYTQPQYLTAVDWGNPLSLGLSAPVTQFSSRVGSPPFVVSPVGLAHSANGSSYLQSSGTVPFTDKITILYVGNFSRPATSNLFGGIGTSGAGNQLFSFQNDTSASARAIIRLVNGGGVTTAESASLGTATPPLAFDVWMAVYNGTSALKLYRNGNDDTAGNANTAATGSASEFDRVCLGGINRGTDAFAQTGQFSVLTLAWNRALSANEIKYISNNPWQIFKAPSRKLWVVGAGSSAAALAGNAAAQASATSSLSTAIPITAASLSMSTAGGALTTAIPLNAVAAATATSSGEMSTQIPIAAVAASQASASGELTTQIRFAGSALAQAVSSALLSSGITMTADAVAKAAVQGTLTTAIRMIANASGNASASAAFSGSPAALSAAAYSQATADAQLTISIQLAASALGQADAQGDLTTRVQLSAAALSSAIASGSLSVPVRFSANAFAQATASATLSDSAYISDPRYTATILGREFYVSSFERKFYAARKEVGT